MTYPLIRQASSGPIIPSTDSQFGSGAILRKDEEQWSGGPTLLTTALTALPGAGDFPEMLIERDSPEKRYVLKGSALFEVVVGSSTLTMSFAIQYSNDSGSTWTTAATASQEWTEEVGAFRLNLISEQFEAADLLPPVVESGVIQTRLSALCDPINTVRWQGGGADGHTQLSIEEVIL